MRLAILLLLGTCLSSQASPANAPAANGKARSAQAQPVDVNDAQVAKWTKVWQKRLSLEDWEISTQIVRTSDLRPNTLGNLHWNNATKTATIHVLDPADYDLPAHEIATDIEYTVLHELIHLQLAALPRDPAAKSTEEKVVNRLSEALFAFEKGSNYRPRTAVSHLQTKDKSSSEASRAVQP